MVQCIIISIVADNGSRMVLALQQSYDQSTDDLPVDDQQSMSPVCALCEVSHSHKGKVSTWQSTQACDVVSWYGITQNEVCWPCRDDVLCRVLGRCTCGCWNKSQTCSEGCECLHCINFPSTRATEQHAASDAVELENEENRELEFVVKQNFRTSWKTQD